MRKQIGFSLLELVMVITIIGVISVLLGKILFEAYETFQISQQASETDWRGFLSLTRISNDIHTLRSNGDLTTTSASQLTFTDMSGTSISYQLSGNSLMRNSQILSSGITGFSLSYLDETGASTSTPSAVRYIKATVVATQGNLSQSYSFMTATRGMV